MTGTGFESVWRERVERIINFSMMGVALAAMVSLILEYGHYVPLQHRYVLQGIDVGIIVIFICETFFKLLIARQRMEHFKHNFVHFLVIGLLVLQLLTVWGLSSHAPFRERLRTMTPGKLCVVLIQVVIGMRLLMEAVEAQKKLARVRVRPAVTLVGSFVCVIAIGTLLLYSPRAVPEGDPVGHIRFIDAMFTASSSVCVTGLIVRDTGAGFSQFGQVVILVLIQIGGLGLMTFAAFFALALGRGLQLTDRMLMRDVLSQALLGRIGRTITAILAITFTFEAIGAALLYRVWQGDISVARRVYLSVFHSVSAFCNAGFCLFSESFTQYAGDWRLNVVVMGLIIVGGIGFAVQANLLRCFNKVVRKLSTRARLPSRRVDHPEARLSVQTRIVLVTTAALILTGAVAVMLLEHDGQLAPDGQPMSIAQRIMASLFQSVTARTAGFNTMHTGSLSMTTLFLLVVLMFIGASPGSTGGGIKTSTFAMLALSVRAMIHGRNEVEVFHRTIPKSIISRVTVILILAAAVVIVSTLALSVTERDNEHLQRTGTGNRFIQVLFEAMSAFGTVGLSTGVTRHLTSAGKVVIVLTMLVGRIGPLTMFVSIGQRTARHAFSYPEEHLMVG